MLIYSGNTPIMLPVLPSPNDNGDVTWKNILVSLVVIAAVAFVFYKLLEL